MDPPDFSVDIDDDDDDKNDDNNDKDDKSFNAEMFSGFFCQNWVNSAHSGHNDATLTLFRTGVLPNSKVG